MRYFLDWLTRYEAVAVWLEGIALAAIFVWDRLEHAKEHKETLAQLGIAQKQIEASHNAERAWVMTELSWFEPGQTRIVTTTSSGNALNNQNIETTNINVKL